MQGMEAIVGRPYWTEVVGYRVLDELEAADARPVLFVGGSSIRLWPGLNRDFPSLSVRNRGIGGGWMAHMVEYFTYLVAPHNPHHIVLYAGENDLSNDVPPEQVLADWQRFAELAGAANIIVLSQKPSPARMYLWPQLSRLNALMEEDIASRPKVSYLDVGCFMFDGLGHVRQELFLRDRLHMNRSGYDLWVRALAPLLKEGKG